MRLLNLSTVELDDRHNYYGGAIGNIAYNLLHSLSRRFANLEIHTLTEGVELTEPLPTNLNIHIIKRGKVMPFSFNVRRAINKILNERDFSIIIYLYFYEPIYVSMLRKIKDYPFVIGMCELPHPRLKDEVDGILKYPALRSIGKNMMFPFFIKTLKYCDRLIVVNNGAKKYYNKFIMEEKIRIIPYGVDPDFFKYSQLPTNTYNILTVSRLIERRGLDYLIEAMPIILKEYPNASLHFVGEGPRKAILQEKAEKLDVKRNVIFHGRVSPEELVNLYRSCYVFCHLSFADGWNQPALEAMATGRPTICTKAPHNSMVEDGNTGFLIPWGNSDILAEKIIYLFGHYSLAEKMGIEGRKKVEREYNWDRIAEEYYKVFCEVAR